MAFAIESEPNGEEISVQVPAEAEAELARSCSELGCEPCRSEAASDRTQPQSGCDDSYQRQRQARVVQGS